MRLFLSVSCFYVFVCGGNLFAQSAAPKRFVAPLAGTVVFNAIDDKYDAQVFSLEMPDPDAGAEQKKLQAIKSQISRQFPHKASPARVSSSTTPSPIVTKGFVADSLPGIPPDNYMALGKNDTAISVINSTIAIHDAGTGIYSSRRSLNSFSVSVGLNNTGVINNNYRYDPKVVYDPEWNRFIAVMLNGTNEYNWIVVGFSQTSNPAGGWNFYKFYGDYTGDTTWFDYPAIAITHNELFLTGNKIKYDSSWQAGFTRTLIYQFKKSDGYNGDTVMHYQIWDSVQYGNQFLRCMHPLNPGDSIMGPSQYFLSNRNFDIHNDSVFLVQVPDTIGSSDTVLTVTPLVSTTQGYGVPPNGRQPDTTYPLATNDGRILGGFITGNQIQFVSTSIDTSSGASAVFHGVINNYQTAPTLSGSIIGIDTLDFGYPNISSGGKPGTSIISFDYSGPRTFPGFGAVYFDGARYSDMTNIVSGTNYINMLGAGLQRWGDYSGSQPDWSLPGSVWVEGIFGKNNQQYGNYIAQLSEPPGVGVPGVNTVAAVNAAVFPNPAIAIVNLSFFIEQEQNFTIFIYSSDGKQVDKLLDNYCREGKNIVRFNAASLRPGVYFLKAVGNKGAEINTQTFVKE